MGTGKDMKCVGSSTNGVRHEYIEKKKRQPERTGSQKHVAEKGGGGGGGGWADGWRGLLGSPLALLSQSISTAFQKARVRESSTTCIFSQPGENKGSFLQVWVPR